MTLSIISLAVACVAVAMTLKIRKLYKRAIEQKDEDIKRLTEASIYKDNVGLRLPMARYYDAFKVVEKSYYYGVYGISASRNAKLLIYISVFYDDKSRMKAKEDAEKLAESLNEWKICVG